MAKPMKKDMDEDKLYRLPLHTTGKNGNILNRIAEKRELRRNELLHIIIRDWLGYQGYTQDAKEWDAPPPHARSNEQLW